MTLAHFIGYGLALYAGAGLGTAFVFVTFGLRHVLPRTSFTAGARLLLLPGAFALWPYVMIRWLKAVRR
jgi:hypothetical protein